MSFESPSRRPPTLSVMPSVSESTSNKSGQPAGKKYYNRPKFLQAPDPSTLATPSFGALDGTGSRLSSLVELVGVSAASAKSTGFQSVWLGDGPYGATCPYTPSALLTLSSQPDASPFSAPFLLQDIEPPKPTMKHDLIHSSTHSNISTTQCVLTTSCSCVYLHSPIMRPMKRARTGSAGQAWPARDLIDSLRCENEYQRKRPRFETHESVSVAQWYTDYLITALTKARCGEVTPSTYVYNKLWKNVIRLLWDLRLSESVVVLAFWYIHRLFPDGFMHPEMFTRSEGGMIAWRIFVLGIMLAEKWLEDGPHGLKTWQPYFELPSNSVRALEQTFLRFLDYNISISNKEWQIWIGTLEDHCRAKIRAGYSQELQSLFMDILCEILDEAMVFSAERDKLRLLYKPESETCQVVLNLLQPYSLDEALELTSSPILLRKRSYFTAWNPAADPVVTARPRSSGIAPIARPAIHGLSSSSVHRSCSLPAPFVQLGGTFYAPIVT